MSFLASIKRLTFILCILLTELSACNNDTKNSEFFALRELKAIELRLADLKTTCRDSVVIANDITSLNVGLSEYINNTYRRTLDIKEIFLNSYCASVKQKEEYLAHKADYINSLDVSMSAEDLLRFQEILQSSVPYEKFLADEIAAYKATINQCTDVLETCKSVIKKMGDEVSLLHKELQSTKEITEELEVVRQRIKELETKMIK